MKTDHEAKKAVLRFIESFRKELGLSDEDDRLDQLTLWLLRAMELTSGQTRDEFIAMMDECADATQLFEKYGVSRLS